jgi:hypothetical protein
MPPRRRRARLFGGLGTGEAVDQHGQRGEAVGHVVGFARTGARRARDRRWRPRDSRAALRRARRPAPSRIGRTGRPVGAPHAPLENRAIALGRWPPSAEPGDKNASGSILSPISRAMSVSPAGTGQRPVGRVQRSSAAISPGSSSMAIGESGPLAAAMRRVKAAISASVIRPLIASQRANRSSSGAPAAAGPSRERWKAMVTGAEKPRLSEATGRWPTPGSGRVAALAQMDDAILDQCALDGSP